MELRMSEEGDGKETTLQPHITEERQAPDVSKKQPGHRLELPNMWQGRTGRQTSETAWTLSENNGQTWRDSQVAEQEMPGMRQGQATLSINPKNCRETVKAPSHMKTASKKWIVVDN